MRDTVMKRPTKTSQSTGEGLSSKGNKSFSRRKLVNYLVAQSNRCPSLKPKESLSLHSHICSNLPPNGFYCEKYGGGGKGVKDRKGPITVGKSNKL